ncbi:glycosyl hydrolase [Epilithonimonas sp. JDS]|uniref:WD40/YVTN/BNR-like repeat-containing protein n=1 Tax=Epilithonimonas sp. JDS TaxID=2902797 RepID=UPI001E332DCA|nr:glycosyl hydrolase [Epilithonimonas sp. JDS]MCD9853328.1 glycosyl hydrolase [Epilithonimonas sp. JDS]
MKKLSLLFLLISTLFYSQQFKIDTLLTDKISIRAIQIWDGKVWYTGTDSKFGYVNMKDKVDKKQIVFSQKPLQFRTLAQNKNHFYAINIESPAYFFQIDKKTLEFNVVFNDNDSTAFYDAFKFVDNDFGIAFSDPTKNQRLNISQTRNGGAKWIQCNDCKDFPYLEKGEAAFAASNTNIASAGNFIWIATGGSKARIYRMKNKDCYWKVFETPFIQGTSSQGIYSIDFYDKNFGIAVGGDYTKQADNINNIATTNDGGQTWQIQASGQNAGYMTCVKFRPKTKGKEIVAVGDQHISFSSDFGKTWTKISDEKNLYACEWLDHDTLILAGKDKIIRVKFSDN